MAPKSNGKKTNQSPKPTKKPKKIEAKAPVQPENRDRGLTIVGIGASAGGLNALSSFFDSLATDTGMAFVVVTHLHPEHESHMAELLQRHTRMPTMQVVSRTKVEPNQVYVIPPNRSILMTDTHLDTREFDEPHGRRTPIDHFFRSMAQSGHSDPIAIILSGGGTDGSVGIKDVKEVGGLILVQQPEDAEYDSMPRAALTTGLVDVVLPARQLAEKLEEYIKHRPQLPHDPGQLSESEMETLQRILAQVHARTGHDFTQYKRSTILRRVERRMQLSGFATLEGYLTYLRGNANESHAMFNDILIGVTNFFRDRDSWVALEKQVIPALFDARKAGEVDGIRVWSIGCATGEEAYGMAMLLFEEAARREERTHIQVFASDLDEKSIARSREGLYPAAIEADVSSERLERFFNREGEYYRVKRELRDVVLFTNHNVMRDPPFSRQDLIACRNVLIYLQRLVQDRVIDIFHYSLNPGGYLFLGSSETAEHLPHLFEVVDKTHRLYQAKPWVGERPHVPAMPLLHLQRSVRTAEIHSGNRPPIARKQEDPTVMEDQHQRSLESYGPPSVLVDGHYAIQHVSESAGRYLLQPKGPITGDLLSLVRPELQLELRTALFHAFEKSKTTVSRPVSVQFNGHRRRVIVSVRPRRDVSGLENMTEQALVLFIEDEIMNPDELIEVAEPPRSQTERDQMVAQLQAELQRLREQLQITAEEYESSNEEMKAANEELQSINEEYRSATEELETNKEELQSVNEELQTVNIEIRNKLDEIMHAHQELEDLMGATDVATLYLNRDLRIQRYTAGVQELFNILGVDRGRRVSDLTHNMEYNRFLEDAEQVLRNLIPLKREIRRADGNWFMMRMRPFRTKEDRIDGVVITFIDIHEVKEAEQELVQAKDMLEQRVQERTHELDEASQKLRQTRDMFFEVFNANPIPTALIRTQDNVLLNVNIEFLNYFSFQHEDVIGHNAEEFNLGLGRKERQDLLNQLRKQDRVSHSERELIHPSGETRNILASYQHIELDNTEALISTFIDITERVLAERQIRSLASDLTTAEQEERSRISQILHDDLQQRIFAVKVQLTSLKDSIQRGSMEDAENDIAHLQGQLDETISITRTLSIDLSPAILLEDSFTDALVWLGNYMHDLYGLNVSIETNGVSTGFQDPFRILLFQAVRESLFNVVKHAGTDSAVVSFETVDGQINLIIRDGGQGFDTSGMTSDPDQSTGLLNLKNRLKLMGCNLSINSQPGDGTQVVINCPRQLMVE